MPVILEIALPIPSNRLFSYLLPEEFNIKDLVGRRALVPFGKRTITGIITAHNNSENTKGLKKIIELLDEQPYFNKNMLKFTKWLADYYLSSWGDVLKAALPGGISPKSVLRVNVLKKLNDEEILQISKRAPKRAALLKLLNEHKENLTVSFLEKKLKSEISSQLEALEEMEIIKCEPVIQKVIKSKLIKAVIINPELLENNDKIKFILNELDKSAPKQSQILSFIYLNDIKNSPPILIKNLQKQFKGGRQSLISLKQKNFLEIIDIEEEKYYSDNPEDILNQRNEIILALTDEQNKVLERLKNAIDEEVYQTFLLHGITGSGKTLIYMHLAEKVINLGKSVLVLVPEISLTPQLIDRFETVFTGKLAVLHSKLGQGERFDSWRQIFNNKKRIILGARSAIFAPIQNLGLIIVDEEHEPSYKQDTNPRYNARDAAIYRGTLENSIVILGSATPSIESMYNALSGKYELLEIKSRADGAELPKIKVVDTLLSRKYGKMLGPFSINLINDIKKRIEKKEGVIIFQNRRGFASFLECHECGSIPICKNCSVSLTYHKHKNQLRCHYCGYTIEAFTKCPECSSQGLSEVGTGTQRLEEELIEILKKDGIEAKIIRMDLDTTRKKDAHRKILKSFSSGKTDILIGTQMVAKGLDLERVTLVGVVNSDLQLFLPDFRASERTYQLLTQVAGRAGRTGGKKGEVIIQTSHPANIAVKASESVDYAMFYNNEIINRSETAYPPFSRFVMLEFSSKAEASVIKASNIFYEFLPKNNQEFIILGPTIPTIYRLRNNYRRIIVIKAIKKFDASGSKLRKMLNYVLDNYNQKFKSSSVRLNIDIDSFSGL